MDPLRTRNWRQMAIFVSITFATLGVMMAIAETYSPRVPLDMLSSPVGKFVDRFIDLSSFLGLRITPPYDADTRIVTLARDQSVDLDRIRITYRGLAQDGAFNVEIIVPGFDREMAFRHSIDSREAKRGFRLYLDQFELISAKADRLQLRYVSNYRR